MSDNWNLKSGFPWPRTALGSPVSLLLVSIVGVSYAHGYEVGYAQFFGVPRELVSIQTTSLPNAVLAMGVAYLTFLYGGSWVLRLAEMDDKTLPAGLRVLGGALLMFACGLATLEPRWWKGPAVWALLGILAFVAGSWAQRTGREIDAARLGWGSPQREFLRTTLVVLVGGVVTVHHFGVRAGHAHAGRYGDNLVHAVDAEGEFVVVGTYGGVLLETPLLEEGVVGPKLRAVVPTEGEFVPRRMSLTSKN